MIRSRLWQPGFVVSHDEQVLGHHELVDVKLDLRSVGEKVGGVL
jgi:hypothetical protein